MPENEVLKKVSHFELNIYVNFVIYIMNYGVVNV
jgi:hypothetical protein